ncbi:MAG TPA: SsrA-binding protein SmpB [Dongiaceae bacterium]|nr:SsrA-binding protein SmpB [Dongiaceae bacterium]
MARKTEPAASSDIQRIVQNRKARHIYHILETVEAGLVLTGTEVKSLRAGKANLLDSYAMVDRGEVWLMNLHISPYEQGNQFNHEPKRKRKLLLHRRDIQRLIGKSREKGLTLIPLSLYFKKGWAKVELALARGKKLHDKREDMAKRDADREMARAMSQKRQK